MHLVCTGGEAQSEGCLLPCCAGSAKWLARIQSLIKELKEGKALGERLKERG